MHMVEIWCSESKIFINLNLLLSYHSYCSIVALGLNTEMSFLRVSNQQLIQNGDFTLDFRFFIKKSGIGDLKTASKM